MGASTRTGVAVQAIALCIFSARWCRCRASGENQAPRLTPIAVLAVAPPVLARPPRSQMVRCATNAPSPIPTTDSYRPILGRTPAKSSYTSDDWAARLLSLVPYGTSSRRKPQATERQMCDDPGRTGEVVDVASVRTRDRSRHALRRRLAGVIIDRSDDPEPSSSVQPADSSEPSHDAPRGRRQDRHTVHQCRPRHRRRIVPDCCAGHRNPVHARYGGFTTCWPAH